MSEADLKRAVEDYLQYQQNLGNLVYLRLNSGDFIEARGELRRRIKGCPKGTADILVLQEASNDFDRSWCAVMFLELKGETGKQSQAQKDFQEIVETQGAEYYLVRSIDRVMEIVGGEA